MLSDALSVSAIRHLVVLRTDHIGLAVIYGYVRHLGVSVVNKCGGRKSDL